MKLTVLKEINGYEAKIENFLNSCSNLPFNPLFNTPLWAKRLVDLIGFEYIFLIAHDANCEIAALQLVFKGYRGYAKINKLPNIIRKPVRFFIKQFFGLTMWNAPACYRVDIKEDDKDFIDAMFMNYLKGKIVSLSPVSDKNIWPKSLVEQKEWGTFILKMDTSYEETYSLFRKSARRSVESTRKLGVVVKPLRNKMEVENWINWLAVAQKYSGKSYKLSAELALSEMAIFNQNGYVYEIFVGYLDDKILGSLGIWGYNGFITEFGSDTDIYAKQNKLYVQDVIKDEIVKYAYQNRIKYFDLAGFNPSADASDKEKAIRQFKEKWGGEAFIYKIISTKR